MIWDFDQTVVQIDNRCWNLFASNKSNSKCDWDMYEDNDEVVLKKLQGEEFFLKFLQTSSYRLVLHNEYYNVNVEVKSWDHLHMEWEFFSYNQNLVKFSNIDVWTYSPRDQMMGTVVKYPVAFRNLVNKKFPGYLV